MSSGQIFFLLGGFAVSSLMFAFIFWATARFVIQERVTFWSCIFAAVLGLLMSFCVSALLSTTLPESGVNVAIPVATFLLGALANRWFLRRAGGGGVTFGQACRIQLAPFLVSVYLFAAVWFLSSLQLAAVR